MSQKRKGLKKEKIQSITNEATNFEISAKTIVSRGNMLKTFLNYYCDDSVELCSEEENYVSLFKSEYDSTMVVIKELDAKVDRLTSTCKHEKIILQISGDKENDLREEINGLKIQLEKKIKEEMRKKYRENEEECEILEVEVVSLSDLEKIKTIILRATIFSHLAGQFATCIKDKLVQLQLQV